MNRPLPLVVLVAWLIPQIALAENDNLSTQLMQCTFKITEGKTNGGV
jgi:hypothetical protein